MMRCVRGGAMTGADNSVGEIPTLCNSTDFCRYASSLGFGFRSQRRISMDGLDRAGNKPGRRTAVGGRAPLAG